MPTFSHSLTIAAAPVAVFGLLTNFSRLPEWVAEVEESAQTSEGPVGAGTTFTQRAQVKGHSVTIVSTVKEHTPPHTLAYTSIAGPVTGQWRYLITPLDNGIQLSISVDLNTGALPALFAPMVVNAIQAGAVKNLQSFKRLLEDQP